MAGAEEEAQAEAKAAPAPGGSESIAILSGGPYEGVRAQMIDLVRKGGRSVWKNKKTFQSRCRWAREAEFHTLQSRRRLEAVIEILESGIKRLKALDGPPRRNFRNSANFEFEGFQDEAEKERVNGTMLALELLLVEVFLLGCAAFSFQEVQQLINNGPRDSDLLSAIREANISVSDLSLGPWELTKE